MHSIARHSGHRRRGPAEPTLARKVALLRHPGAYPERTESVQCVETHLSWVFLTDTRAYKLKKPVRRDGYDLTTVAARAAHCRLEIVLNGRLTEGVYLGAVPIGMDASGELHLDRGGVVVDWLIRMRRLPAELMLDRLIETRRLGDGDLTPLVARLARFYRAIAPEPIGGAAFRDHLAARIASSTAALCAPGGELDIGLVEDVAERQLAFLELHAEAIDRRVALGHIVEGHGDLRPEHVCLEPFPQVIDCLEFSRELRIVDVAEELGFLALECERLGAPRARGEIFAAYAELSGDRPDPRLVDFYQSLHACIRGSLAVAHLREPERDDREKWRRRGAEYLRLAAQHIGRERV
jgi:aminoglycoside phosphotransferase family enzyme